MRTITYTYDPLYRLIQANYSTGEVFEYTYNKLGNRMRYTQTITTPVVTVYIYDAANRLTSVNGQTYTWDNNGNLLSDGSKNYTYDAANRLTGITAAGLTWSAAYNGDGARIKQTINGVGIFYTLDLAAPLVTVLAEKQAASHSNKTYLYGPGDSPLASYDGEDWTYLSGRDGLNSVRQETDADGNVIATRSFDPYGVPMGSDGGSPFGYTGEQYDTYIKLMFLRARMYQPGLGVFLSRDPWSGDALRPGSRNGWNYVEGNPVNRVDSSGEIPRPPDVCPYPASVFKALGYIIRGKDGKIIHYPEPRDWNAEAWVYCGHFSITAYQFVVESAYIKVDGTLKYPQHDRQAVGAGFSTSYLFVQDVEANGTGKADISLSCTAQNNYFSSVYSWEEEGNISFTYNCGRGRPEITVDDAYKAVAFDPAILNWNSQIYLPDLEDKSGEPEGNADFVTKDRGGDIIGYHLDVFTGEGPGILTGDNNSVPSLLYTSYQAGRGISSTKVWINGRSRDALWPLAVYQRTKYPWFYWQCVDEY